MKQQWMVGLSKGSQRISADCSRASGDGFLRFWNLKTETQQAEEVAVFAPGHWASVLKVAS